MLAKTPDKYERHPLAADFPPLVGEEFTAFAENIRTQGLNEAIWLYEDKILDGNNRYAACIAVDRKPAFRHFSGTHKEARDFVLSANLHRRHLTNKQKQEIVEMLIKQHPEKSDRSIAKTAKVSNSTVGIARKKLEGGVRIEHLKKRVDSRGRNQSATKRTNKKKTIISTPDKGRAIAIAILDGGETREKAAGDHGFSMQVAKTEVAKEQGRREVLALLDAKTAKVVDEKLGNETAPVDAANLERQLQTLIATCRAARATRYKIAELCLKLLEATKTSISFVNQLDMQKAKAEGRASFMTAGTILKDSNPWEEE